MLSDLRGRVGPISFEGRDGCRKGRRRSFMGAPCGIEAPVIVVSCARASVTWDWSSCSRAIRTSRSCACVTVVARASASCCSSWDNCACAAVRASASACRLVRRRSWPCSRRAVADCASASNRSASASSSRAALQRWLPRNRSPDGRLRAQPHCRPRHPAGFGLRLRRDRAPPSLQPCSHWSPLRRVPSGRGVHPRIALPRMRVPVPHGLFHRRALRFVAATRCRFCRLHCPFAVGGCRFRARARRLFSLHARPRRIEFPRNESTVAESCRLSASRAAPVAASRSSSSGLGDSGRFGGSEGLPRLPRLVLRHTQGGFGLLQSRLEQSDRFIVAGGRRIWCRGRRGWMRRCLLGRNLRVHDFIQPVLRHLRGLHEIELALPVRLRIHVL
jgi:hypothetical protein